MLRVAYNVRFFSAANTRGIGRYALNLLRGLPNHGVQPILCSNAPLNEAITLPNCEVVVEGPRQPLVWDQTWERLAARAGASIMHALGNFGLPLRSTMPTVLTLHDAIDYSFYKDRTMAWHEHWNKTEMITRWIHWSARQGARRIITVSEQARREIHRRLRVPLSKLSVTYEAADEAFFEVSESDVTAMRQRFDLHEPYFFYYGGWETRKNVPYLLDAFAEAKVPGVRLALAGGSHEAATELKAQAERLALSDRVTWLGRVDDADLRTLLTGALAFVYPSLAEGFGLQLCEAMACGCPVLAARASCLPEILGNGGESFSLHERSELAGQLRRVANDAAYRLCLTERSRNRGRDFSWDRCAEQTADVYRRMLKE